MEPRLCKPASRSMVDCLLAHLGFGWLPSLTAHILLLSKYICAFCAASSAKLPRGFSELACVQS